MPLVLVCLHYLVYFHSWSPFPVSWKFDYLLSSFSIEKSKILFFRSISIVR